MDRLLKSGRIRPADAKTIGPSRIGLGFEKLDRRAFEPENAYAPVAATGVHYIRLQSGITTHLKTISALESQVAELKADNDAAEKRIETAVDLATIKDVAMNQLGMGYAGPDQIIHYTVDKEDYMNQFEDIPNK